MTRFLLCSFALVLLYPAGIDMYLVGLPRIAADLQASEAQLHIAFSVYLAGMATAMLFAGKVADQSGRKPVAIVGALIYIAASGLCSLAESGTPFLVGRFIQGVGAGCCYVVAFAILRDTLDDRSTKLNPCRQQLRAGLQFASVALSARYCPAVGHRLPGADAGRRAGVLRRASDLHRAVAAGLAAGRERAKKLAGEPLSAGG